MDGFASLRRTVLGDFALISGPARSDGSALTWDLGSDFGDLPGVGHPIADATVMRAAARVNVGATRRQSTVAAPDVALRLSLAAVVLGAGAAADLAGHTARVERPPIA